MFLLFADDKSISIQGQNVNEMTNILKSELVKVSDLLKSNRLTLSVSKSFYMISSVSNINAVNNRISINNNCLIKVNNFKFLGVTIDEKLTWKSHIYHISTKISQITGIIYRIRNSISSDCLRLIYMAIAYPQLLYCSAIWGRS